MPSLLALSLSELVLTFLLIFVHLRFLSRTWLNKVPAVFAAIATVFAAGGIQHLPLCALSAVIGISMAVGTEVLIQRLVKYPQNHPAEPMQGGFFKKSSPGLDKFTWQWYLNHAKKTWRIEEAAP